MGTDYSELSRQRADYNALNRQQTERLKSLRRLSDADLARPVGEHWTVGVALAHLAYFDKRALGALEAWRRHGVRLELWVDAEAAVNDIRLPIWREVPPRAALEDAIRAAEALDALLASLTPEEVEAVRAERWAVLFRCRHRDAHLTEIEQALAA